MYPRDPHVWYVQTFLNELCNPNNPVVILRSRSTRRIFGWFRTFIIPRPYYDSSHRCNYNCKRILRCVRDNGHCSIIHNLNNTVGWGAGANRQTSGESASLPQYLGSSRYITLPLHSSHLRLIPYLHHTSSILR
jgi:hypothetical protein